MDQLESTAGLRFLAEAGKVLGSSLDYEATLKIAARLGIQYLADACSIFLLTDNGMLESVEVAHRLPEKEAILLQVKDLFPVNQSSENAPLKTVIRTGEPRLTAEVSPVTLNNIDSNHEHQNLLSVLE